MNINNNRVYFGSISATELVAEFGSPLYVYERDLLVRQFERFNDAFKDTHHSVYYACKANSNIELLKIFKQLGAGIDAVSPGEIFLALRAGFKSGDILLTGTNLTRSDLAYALGNNVLVNIDNISMIEENQDLFRGKDVAIRLNPDIYAGGHEYLATGHREAKFGVREEDLEYLMELISKLDITVVGLHQHIGSDITDAAPLVESLGLLLKSSLEIPSVRFIDIGGGFKVKYKEQDYETDVGEVGREISEQFNTFCREHKRRLRLVLEPGKYLVSEAGYLLATVQSIKRNDEKLIVGTDTGMNHLIRPALYDAYHEIINASRVAGKPETADIVGNICESADVLGKNRDIPQPGVGDILCIKNAGSYGYSMASIYNAHMLPAEVLIEHNTVRMIRRRQKFEDLLNLNVG
jgi:diaminopimelate decarboxylase